MGCVGSMAVPGLGEVNVKAEMPESKPRRLTKSAVELYIVAGKVGKATRRANSKCYVYCTQPWKRLNECIGELSMCEAATNVKATCRGDVVKRRKRWWKERHESLVADWDNYQISRRGHGRDPTG